ncbi:MAG: hypothetical protein ACREA0_33820, partial [bacterium]
MTRLTDTRIAYAVAQAKRGMEGRPHETPGQMAARWGLTSRRVRQVIQTWRETGTVPTINPNRRPKAPPLTEDQKRAIADAYGRSPRGASKVYKSLSRAGIKIPKHKIHAYLRLQGWTRPNPKKQKRRTRIRYEREHSGSLIHGDWHRTNENSPHVILWLDDASRCVLSGGEYENATGELSIQTLDAALKQASQWGLDIRQVNTDRGAQFSHNPGQDIEQGVTQFQKYLHAKGIQHVLS